MEPTARYRHRGLALSFLHLGRGPAPHRRVRYPLKRLGASPGNRRPIGGQCRPSRPRALDWSIENRLHDVRDVTLGEDASRIRRNTGLFALLRNFALNLLRSNGVSNISLGLYDNALNFDRLLAYQGL